MWGPPGAPPCERGSVAVLTIQVLETVVIGEVRRTREEYWRVSWLLDVASHREARATNDLSLGATVPSAKWSRSPSQLPGNCPASPVRRPHQPRANSRSVSSAKAQHPARASTTTTWQTTFSPPFRREPQPAQSPSDDGGAHPLARAADPGHSPRGDRRIDYSWAHPATSRMAMQSSPLRFRGQPQLASVIVWVLPAPWTSSNWSTPRSNGARYPRVSLVHPMTAPPRSMLTCT